MTWDARVTRAMMIARSVRLIEFRAVDGSPFPLVEPGAHLSVHTPAGPVRTYSITERTEEGGYVICVARHPRSRGGSLNLHEGIAAGDVVRVSPPTNAFPLVEARSYLLIAGGIGITPIRAMYRALAGHPRVRMLYLGRSPEEMAYAEEFEGRDGVTLHYSRGTGRLDLWSVLERTDDETHLYCCAGPVLMEQVRLRTMHWRPSHLHFENFAGVPASGTEALPFEAVWQPDGRIVQVGAEETLLSALRRDGISVASSCESGTCGTCVLQLLRGEVRHRDLVLPEAERSRRMISCVSRAVADQVTVGPVPVQPDQR